MSRGATMPFSRPPTPDSPMWARPELDRLAFSLLILDLTHLSSRDDGASIQHLRLRCLSPEDFDGASLALLPADGPPHNPSCVGDHTEHLQEAEKTADEDLSVSSDTVSSTTPLSVGDVGQGYYFTFYGGMLSASVVPCFAAHNTIHRTYHAARTSSRFTSGRLDRRDGWDTCWNI